jgi:hypothetical protein
MTPLETARERPAIERSLLATWFGRDSRFSLPIRVGIGAAVLAVIVLNALLVANQFSIILAGFPGADFRLYQEASERVWSGGLYLTDGTYTFRYSPVAAYLFYPLPAVDPALWRVLHVAAALALPTWPMRILLLASWPFAFDLQLGNLMTFILVVAVYAMRGNRVAVLIFLAVTLLAPRPLVLPIAGWLLWRQPGIRLPFVAMFVVHAVLVLFSGWADEWIVRLLTSTDEIESAFNVGPTAVVGAWWLLIGVPLGIWLFWRGWVGLAGVAVTPYVLPYYLMLAPVRADGRESGHSDGAGTNLDWHR